MRFADGSFGNRSQGFLSRLGISQSAAASGTEIEIATETVPFSCGCSWCGAAWNKENKDGKAEALRSLQDPPPHTPGWAGPSAQWAFWLFSMDDS